MGDDDPNEAYSRSPIFKGKIFLLEEKHVCALNINRKTSMGGNYRLAFHSL